MPIPFLEPGQSPYPTALGGPIPVVLANALIKQTEGAIDVLQGLHHQWNCFAQEVEKTENKLECTSNWIRDILDQKMDVKDEIGQMELELKQCRQKKKGWKPLVWVTGQAILAW